MKKRFSASSQKYFTGQPNNCLAVKRGIDMRKRAAVLTLAFLLCCCAAFAQAVSSPMLESFSGSGIRKKEPAGKLQKTILSIMRAKKSTRLKDVVTENDSFVDQENHETEVRDAEIEVLFTPEVYRVNQDGTADFLMRLADAGAFAEKEAAIVVGIPQGTGEHASVKYIEISAVAVSGQVQTVFPAWVITEMRRSILSGWNCVCMVVSREQEAPGMLLEFSTADDLTI